MEYFPDQEYLEIPVHFLYLFQYKDSFVLSEIIKINKNIIDNDYIPVNIYTISKRTMLDKKVILRILNRFLLKKVISLFQQSPNTYMIKINYKYLNELMDSVESKVRKREEMLNSQLFNMEI